MSMQVIRALAILVAILTGGAAAAGSFDRCEKDERRILNEAIDGARELTLAAAGEIRNDANYRRWFGTYTPRNAAIVRRNVKAIHRALVDGEIRSVCAEHGEDDCKVGMFANVWADDPYVIYFCPSFFTQPKMYDYAHTHPQMDDGSREGTIIHEISHFENVASTDDDLCYSRSVCAPAALSNPSSAITNADNYQYFIEDAGRR